MHSDGLPRTGDTSNPARKNDRGGILSLGSRAEDYNHVTRQDRASWLSGEDLALKGRGLDDQLACLHLLLFNGKVRTLST